MLLDETHALLMQTASNFKYNESIDFFTVRDQIRTLGIGYFPDEPFGEENIHTNKNSLLLQEPNQFASLITFLANQKCESFCEIGVFQGWSTLLIAAVLSRKNKNLKIHGIDPYSSPNEQVRSIFKIMNIDYEHHFCDAADVKEMKFDITLIDGNHIYEYVQNDWENIGKHSKICIFHDVTNKFANDHNGGPERFFKELKGTKILFSSKTHVMGIGIIILQ